MRNDRQFIMLMMSLCALFAAIIFFSYQSKNYKKLTEKEFLLKDLARQNNELQESFNDKIYVLDDSLRKTSRELNSKLTELKELSQDNDRLKSATQVQLSKIEELSLNTERLAKEKAALEDRMRALESEKAKVLSVAPAAATAAPVSISGSIGQILQVNKEYLFVVFSAGTDKGIQRGDELTVMRSGTVIGKISAERISDKSTAAGILPEHIAADFRVGDQVFD